LLAMDAVVLNCVTQFSIVWRVGTLPFLPMSTRHVTVAESLFLKNVPTAKARCCSDQRCMMTEGFKPLCPAMCLSPHHIQRCRHDAKFKSSNCFCSDRTTLYMHLIGTANRLTLWDSLSVQLPVINLVYKFAAVIQPEG